MKGKLGRAILLLEKYLSDIFGSIRVYREGSELLVPWGSTVINVEVEQEGEKLWTAVYSPVALRVKPGKDLLKFLLMENASLRSCAFYIEFEKGLIDIILGLRIRFDFLTKDFLADLTINLGNMANEYCREVIAVFGGLSFKEYVERRKLQKKPFGEKKILHDVFPLSDLSVSLEIYELLPEGTYMLVGKVKDTGQVFLKAERKKSLQDMFELLKNLKELIIRKDLKGIRKLVKYYEVEDYILFSLLTGSKGDRVKKLREIEKEINSLTDMLMKGDITHDEYRKRMSDIEKLFGL